MAITYKEIDLIKTILIEWYGFTIFPNMNSPVSHNFINGKRVVYAAQSLELSEISETPTLGKLSFDKEYTRLAQEIALQAGAKRIEFQDQSFDCWGYRKFFAFYEITKTDLRFAIGDYK